MRMTALAILLVGCFGCSSNQRVIVTPYNGTTPSNALHVSSTFTGAMKLADFTQAESLSTTDEQRRCARAFRLFAEGDERASEALLNELAGVRDSLVQDYRQTLLGQMYFARGRWSELCALSQQEQSGADASSVLASAYMSCPKEELRFDGAFAKIPIALSSTGTPIVEVEVNGVKKKFWFDTGAGLTVIASDAAEECGVRMIGSDTTVSGTATSKTVAIMPAELSDLKIGGLRVRHHPVMIIDKKDLEFKLLGFITLMKIDGIIGWNLIQQLGWEIDYKNKTLDAFASDTSVRTTADANFFWLGYPTVAVRDSAGRKFLIGMDTGAKQTTLTKEYVAFAKAAPGEVESKTYGSAGGYEETQVQKLANISLVMTGRTIFFPEIYTHDHELTPVISLHGTFGSDIAQQGRLVIDYPRRRIVLE
jgi:predicted aspartyl protease